ncbi:Fur family transcriptional regulator [Corynebacterium timonense]|uniref:Fur family transcriptional regulator, ferric uptake regulator n=1 Tax=Corynebacterium timonense TaxID=441500 RepID=A0A1H1M3J7_9CORY|nr:Fur family transcriptional regulator [Corynebacterium timonense]SDR81398.1 Fur family transcriptional regulator, ferric uptake regulator [Corynebacterium timonense]
MPTQRATQPKQPKLGVRNTRQREAVVRVLQDVDKFISARFIHDELLSRGDKVGLTTVYRTLQSLNDVGAVDVLHNADGETLYRHCLTDDHHHHLVCTICGRSEEIEGGPVEKWAQLVADRFGYELIGHDAEVYGVCRACQQNR